MHIHCIIHESYEGPGYFSDWAASKNYRMSFSRVYLDEALPEDSDGFDLLIILGGPQSPATSQSDCPYFDSQAEQRLIRQAIQTNKAVVGGCLGAQLIGEALGARYQKSPHAEIGYFPIELTAAGKSDINLKTFSTTEVVGHWHNDMPGLTPNCEVLATSEACPRQIVRYTNLVFGFQCHLEFISSQLAPLIAQENAFSCTQKMPYIQSPEFILGQSTARMNQLLGHFLDNLVLAYQAVYTPK
ncbi:type 1 glutamine amidotransferase [Shewanella putrefaciens]